MLTDINLLQDIINIRSLFTLSSVSWDTHNPNSLILISRVSTFNFTQNNLDNFANLQFLHSLIGNKQDVYFLQTTLNQKKEYKLNYYLT